MLLFPLLNIVIINDVVVVFVVVLLLLLLSLCVQLLIIYVQAGVLDNLFYMVNFSCSINKISFTSINTLAKFVSKKESAVAKAPTCFHGNT